MSKLVHSHKSESFAAEIGEEPGGKRFVKLSSPMFLQHTLKTRFKIGEKVTMKLTSKKPRRTDRQNRYYWGAVLPNIARETGEDKHHDSLERLHNLFKGMFLTETIAEVLGEKVRITRSTTDLTVVEFGDFILDIENFTGVLSPPTENYDLAPLKRSKA